MDTVTVLISESDIKAVCPREYNALLESLDLNDISVEEFLDFSSEEFIGASLQREEIKELECIGQIKNSYDRLVLAYKKKKGLTLEIYQSQWITV